MFPNQFYSPVGSSLLPLTKKTINWSGLLTNTQKTLNIVNQAIPIVYQIKPMVNNAKTICKVANEFNKTNSTNPVNTNINKYTDTQTTCYDDGPNFFI